MSVASPQTAKVTGYQPARKDVSRIQVRNKRRHFAGMLAWRGPDAPGKRCLIFFPTAMILAASNSIAQCTVVRPMHSQALISTPLFLAESDRIVCLQCKRIVKSASEGKLPVNKAIKSALRANYFGN